MAVERKFSDYHDSVNYKQRQRQRYASKVEHCNYHEIFSRNLVSTPTQIISTCDTKALTVVPRDLYRPLAPFQIRVLHIEAGEFDEPLKTSLATVDLLLEGGVVDPTTRNHCTYEAVSHNWGDQRIGGVLHCNNKIMALRGSQHTMLKHLRSKSERRSVWLDSICVNQDDIAERAAQVGKMFTIFKHAQRVLIWLGVPKPRTAQVFEALTKMKATQLLQKVNAPQFSQYRLDAQTPFVPDMCSNCHAEFASGIDEFSAFPWFRRTWVRQEIFASNAATLLCGPLEFSWSEFVCHIRIFAERLIINPNSAGIDLLAKQLELLDTRNGKTRLDDKDLPTGSLSFVHELFDQQISQYPYSGADLFCVLSYSASFESSDPRDIIYGVLGMSNARTTDCRDGRPFLTIDYSWNALQVFRKATEYFIRREKCLDAMFLAQFNRDPLGKGASWCPYWPVMNCESGNLRKLCHVNLLDRHSNHVSLAFDGTNWPRVIDAETIDVRVAAQPDDFCSFNGSGIQIEGHALGMIKIQTKADETRELIFTVFDKNVVELSTTAIKTNEGLEDACSKYAPLRIEHAVAHLNTFIKRIRDETEDKTAMWPQGEIDRLCLASVPATTRDGDLLCFLRASSAFVVLRPFELSRNVCRAHFVGTAFASQGIFDQSKLMRADAHDWTISRNWIYHQVQADIEAFNRITKEPSDDEIDRAHGQFSDPPTLSPTPSMSISNGSGNEAHTSRPRKRTPPVDPVILKPFIKRRNRLQQVGASFQQHFDGPIRSLKMTFDIV